MESYIRKKDIVQAMVRAGKAEYILRLDDFKEARENRDDIAFIGVDTGSPEGGDDGEVSLSTRVKIVSTRGCLYTKVFWIAV